MFHSGAASAPYMEEQNMYEEDEIVSGWVDMPMTAEGCSGRHVSQCRVDYGLRWCARLVRAESFHH